MPGPFQIKYFGLTDLEGNDITIPFYTAVSLFLSGASMIKAGFDLNLLRIHVNEDFKFGNYAEKCFAHMPFMVASGFFNLYALSILVTYVNIWTLLPILIVLISNLIYCMKRYVLFLIYQGLKH